MGESEWACKRKLVNSHIFLVAFSSSFHQDGVMICQSKQWILVDFPITFLKQQHGGVLRSSVDSEQKKKKQKIK